MATAAHPQTQGGAQPQRIDKIPRLLLRAMLAMVLVSLALAVIVRLTGMEPAATPPDATTPVVAERMIQIMGNLDGSATVRDGEGGLIAEYGPMEAGFISGVHRALARERKLAKVEGNPAVRIVRYADGRLGLRDPATGWRVELIGFGATNRDAFAALLD
jgi:putative photosynthetic complex assembly protein